LRVQQLRLVVFVMIGLFLVMLAYTIYWFVDYNDKYGYFDKTTAVVVENKEIDEKKYSVLKYDVGKHEYRITTEYPTDFEIGENVKIYYDRNNPIGFVFKLDSRRIILPIITGVFGACCIGLLSVYILFWNSIRNK